MTRGQKTAGRRKHRLRRIARAIREAFAEFLLIPTLVILGFMLLAAATFALDRGEAAWLAPLRDNLEALLFKDERATGELLSAIATGLITITSITVSLLLIALQQSASALTHQVYDQFLRHWQNQFHFGVFVGLSLYALVTLGSVGSVHPVIGASVALIATLAALYLLLLLFYTTVNQMRPDVIIDSIHHHTLVARHTQLRLLRRTRRSPRLQAAATIAVNAVGHGFVTRIDIDGIEAAIMRVGGEVEVVLWIAVGDYIVFGQRLADVNAANRDIARPVADVLEDAITRERTRDITVDPLDGIEELETIGWTSISTAQSDPDAGKLTILSLRDLLARWAVADDDTSDARAAPVVYVDNVLPRLLDAFESLAVVASESMQHQSYAEILRTFAFAFEALPDERKSRVEEIVLRTLSGLGDHVLTAKLESAITALLSALDRSGKTETAAALRTAKDRLARSIGKIGARSTRAAGRN